jgi:hypothetical protein
MLLSSSVPLALLWRNIWMSVVTCKKLFIVTWMLIYIQALNFVISIVLCVVKD